MNLIEAINTRRTVRVFKDYKPSLHELEVIADAARLAPSATNTQNWEFIAISNKDLLNKMAEAIDLKYDELIARAIDETLKARLIASKKHATFFKDAPVTFVIIETERTSPVLDFFKSLNLSEEEMRNIRPDSSMLSLGGAIENMILAAHNFGYSACWMVAPVVASDTFSELLGLDETKKVVSILPIGMSAMEKPAVPFKKSLKDVFKVID